jgi:DNA ligase-4
VNTLKSSFSSLIREISKLRPSQSKSRPKRGSNNLEYPAFRIFGKWVEELHKRFSPLPPNTTSICFQFLFPEEDVHRKYNIQEARMVQLLADCFGIDNKTFENWSQEEATGCLGQELKVVLQRSCSVSKPIRAEETF